MEFSYLGDHQLMFPGMMPPFGGAMMGGWSWGLFGSLSVLILILLIILLLVLIRYFWNKGGGE